MLRYRQSSLPTGVFKRGADGGVVGVVGAGAVDAAVLHAGVAELLGRPDAGPGFGSAGAFQRSAPTGGLAKGRPFQDQVPERALSSTPSTWPWAVLRTVGASAGGVVGGGVGVMVGVVAAAGGGTLNGGGGGSAAGGGHGAR